MINIYFFKGNIYKYVYTTTILLLFFPRLPFSIFSYLILFLTKSFFYFRFEDPSLVGLNYENALQYSIVYDDSHIKTDTIESSKNSTCDFAQQTDLDTTKKTKPRLNRRTSVKRKKEVENKIVEIFEKKLEEKKKINDEVFQDERLNGDSSNFQDDAQDAQPEEAENGETDPAKENIRAKKKPEGNKKKTKTKKIITCEFCGKNFERNGNYLEHRRTHTGEKPFECAVCLMRFGSHAGLSRHKFVHQDSRTFVCDICNKIFKHQIQLKYHKETHTNTTPLSCDMCSYTTLSKHYLNLHRATHLNRDRFVCGICNKGFNSRTYLLEHMNKHSGDKPFLCDICGKSYPARYSLAIHKQMKHDPNYKPRGRVPCQFCGKMILNRKQDLVRHRGIHTGEKPYVCHFCGKAVTNRESLKTHVRLHTGEKPFSCETCGTNFVSKNLLRVHKRTHTGEKPYCCNVCDKSFTQRSSLVVHQRTHASDRQLECEQCNKVFVGVHNLNDHQKTHANSIFVYRVLT